VVILCGEREVSANLLPPAAAPSLILPLISTFLRLSMQHLSWSLFVGTMEGGWQEAIWPEPHINILLLYSNKNIWMLVSRVSIFFFF
jgi:hypothetical protein